MEIDVLCINQDHQLLACYNNMYNKQMSKGLVVIIY